MNKHILAIAGSDIDYFYQVEDFLQPGDACQAIPQSPQIGGCVLNVAAVAASLGSDVKAIDILKKNDESTNLLIRGLSQRGVDTSYIQQDESATNGTCIILQKGDEKCIYFIEPKRGYYRIDDKMQRLLNESAFIYSLQHTLKLSFENFECLKEAKRHGAKIVFDGGCQYNDPDEVNILMNLADGLFINVKAYQRLCAAAGYEAKDKLLENGALFVAITDGENGATVYSNQGTYYHPSYPVKVVDSTGAGDSFAGCFLHFLSRGYSLEDCLELACGNGAMACLKQGGMAGAVKKEELFDFIGK